jgi:hypothetical protein
MSLIASDSGHIARLFRRFHGGGSNRFSQTIDAGNYSENSPGDRTFASIRRAQPAGLRSGSTTPRFATHMYFERHDAAFSVSKLQTQIGCSAEADRSDAPMQVSFSRMLTADSEWISMGAGCRAKDGASFSARTWRDERSPARPRTIACCQFPASDGV